MLEIVVFAALIALAGCALAQQPQPYWVVEDTNSEIGTPWHSVYEVSDITQFQGTLSSVRLNTFDGRAINLLSESTTLARLDLSAETVAHVISDEEIKQLCKCQTIEWLDISNAQKLTDDALAAIAGLPRLSTLIARYVGDREGGRKFSLKGVELLAACRSLKVLALGLADTIGANPYSRYAVLSKLKSLRELGDGLGAAAAAAMCDIPAFASCSAISDEAVEVIVNRSRVESLRLVGRDISKRTFWALEHSASLREVVLEGETGGWDRSRSDLFDVAASLRRCSRLESLTLSEVHTINYKVERAPGEEKIRWWLDDSALLRLLLLPVPKAVPGCEKLLHLNLDRNPNITSEGLASICEAYPQLVSLSVQGCSGLDGRALDAIATLKNLKHLRIGYAFVIDKYSKPSFTAADAFKLAKLTNLKSLDVSGTDPAFAKEALAVALGLKTLESLRATYCGLTDESVKPAPAASLIRMDLSSNSIGNAGIREISKSLPKLTALALDNCSNINDDELGSDLAECANLVALRLKSNGLDLAKLKQIKAKLPKCAVEY